MLALIISLLMTANTSPTVLTVPIPNPQTQWLTALSNCESNGSTTVRVLDTNGRYSYGLFQFQLGTWLAYGKDFGATKENIYSPDLQWEVAKSMLDAGGWKNWWNCGRDVEKSLGVYPAMAVSQKASS